MVVSMYINILQAGKIQGNAAHLVSFANLKFRSLLLRTKVQTRFIHDSLFSYLDLYSTISAVAFRVSGSFAALFSLLTASPYKRAKPVTKI